MILDDRDFNVEESMVVVNRVGQPEESGCADAWSAFRIPPFTRNGVLLFEMLPCRVMQF